MFLSCNFIMKENDYISRIWPSGNITMGKAVRSSYSYDTHQLMFYSLENYNKDGGVTKGDVYGYLDNNTLKHRLATPIEIHLFNKRGYLGIPESNSKTKWSRFIRYR